MATRLEHANFTVPDIDAAIAFLQTIEPGFQVLHDSGGADGYRWVHVGTFKSYLALEEPHEPTPDAAMKRRYADYGVNHIGLVVDDLAAAAERLLAAGYREGFVAEPHPSRLRRYFHDSAGFEWELVEYLTDDPKERFRYD